MVAWWVAWALAGEPRTVAFAPELPAGVALTPVARELARGVPAGVAFTVEGPPVLRDGVLVFRGTLANAGARSATVYLTASPGSGGPFLLAPRNVAYVSDPADPPPPVGSRSPVEVVLPAGGRVPFEAGLRMDRWAWPEGGGDLDVDWSFEFWGAPVKGTVAGRLQPRKPAPQGG